MNEEELLQALACYGCEFKDDCVEECEDFEHGHAWCDEMYKRAKGFKEDILDNLEA